MSEKYRHGIPERYERKEAAEVFRASLGFDFVFFRDDEDVLRCYCVEINGHDSGVVGVQDIPKQRMGASQKILAGVRSTEDLEVRKKRSILDQVSKTLQSAHRVPPEIVESVQTTMRKAMKEKSLFTHAYRNPSLVEEIASDKRLQERYIPEEYRPRAWHPGENSVSSTGAWVVKRAVSRGGAGVHVLTNEEMRKFMTELGSKADEYVVQEFVWSAGAQSMPESWDRRAASMRLLVDFRYLEDGTIVPDYRVAYQRVAPGTYIPGEGGRQARTRNEAHVVNRATGAVSVEATPDETRMAKDIADHIIHNIADDYMLANRRGGDVPERAA